MKIVLVDDHPLVIEGLLSVLNLESDIEILGVGNSISEGIELIRMKNPDLVLVDLKLGRECGLDLISAAKKLDMNSKFIVLTSSASYSDFMMAEEHGAEGYVLKQALPEELIYAIRMVGRGRKYYDPELLEYKLKQDENNFNEQLTSREWEVLQELSKGLNNRQIAKKLFISENTVKKHMSQIFAKLGLHDRTQAALYVKNLELDKHDLSLV
ncbi:LuxR C-terminal-related transcriptional regulator [Lederbergia panacisoli]|uniref:LuxR C-terminal-related transcriptional regulator n=1 Tax=Lederbergia panacisoli TaxID=1255251 RepID=UPI00214BEB60|nr:response regulator transcription factor [Lederbergia panacisoli]MCR2823282.1 response regulator transcription factor [Lederbergia panacisoli]